MSRDCLDLFISDFSIQRVYLTFPKTYCGDRGFKIYETYNHNTEALFCMNYLAIRKKQVPKTVHFK